jgi:hypothetical protein
MLRRRQIKNLMKIDYRQLLAACGFALLAATISFPSISHAQVSCNLNGQTTPAGLSGFLVMDAEGVFDPMTSNYVLPPGNDFDVNVLGRTPAQISSRQLAAFNFFLTRFGVDFFAGTPLGDGTVLSADGNVLLFHTSIDPRWKQRIIYSGGDEVPQVGWPVHEARYAATVISGTHTLTGTWGGAGELVPLGTTMADGEWVIEREVPCVNDSDGSSAGTQSSLIHLGYRTEIPFVPDFLNRAAIDYEVTPISGVSATTGQATGRIELNIIQGDLIQAIVKATIRLW